VFTDNIIIPSGSSMNINIIGLEGVSTTWSGTGDGTINQTIRLSNGPVLWGSVNVNIDGTDWYEVDYFTDSQPRPEFIVQYDANYNAYIFFGNNQTGQVPSSGSIISISYRVGGGVAGNIVTGSVSFQQSVLIPGLEYRIPVTFQNYTKGDGGYDGDTIEQIKLKLPPYLRTQNRIVSPDDFYTFINQFATQYSGSIGKGTAVLRNYGCAANVIDAYVLALSGTMDLDEASPELKMALQSTIDANKMMNCTVCINDGEVIDVDVAIDVVMDRFYKKFQDTYSSQIQILIDSFFSLVNWDFNQNLNAADVVKALSGITVIQSAVVELTTSDPNNSGSVVAAKYYQIIRPNTITINFVYTTNLGNNGN
jgi:hypothetical protein